MVAWIAVGRFIGFMILIPLFTAFLAAFIDVWEEVR
jgi:hypothetical protein